MSPAYVQELAYQPDYYEGLKVWAYAPSHYYKKSVKEDDYSFNILRSKSQDMSDYFYPRIKAMHDELKKEGKIGQFDLVVVIPKSEKGAFSPTLIGIGKKLATETGSVFELILERNHSLPKSRELDLKKRYERIYGSISLLRNLEKNEKAILLLDDTLTTGVSCLESATQLKAVGADNIILFCLGINY